MQGSLHIKTVLLMYLFESRSLKLRFSLTFKSSCLSLLGARIIFVPHYNILSELSFCLDLTNER